MSLSKCVGRVACVAVVLGLGSLARAQEGGGPPKPTAEHKVLAEDVGTWDAVIKAYMGGPDAEPAISKGSEVNKMMGGGMWALSEFKGEFGGQPFEGHGQYGYDPLKKKYIGTWIDSMAPTLAVLEGTYDAKTKTMTYEGDGVDVATKAKYSMKMVTAMKDDGTKVFTLYMKMAPTGDKEVKFMEITYTKRK
jgi:hypothetical protein